MEIIENKSLPWLNITFKKNENKWIFNTKHEIILKNNINEYECVEKFIAINDAVIAEFDVRKSFCKILKTKNIPDINMFNKYADTINNMKNFSCLKNENIIYHNNIKKCIEICKKDDNCIFAMHNVTQNNCMFINSVDKKNNKLYIKI